MMMVQLGSCMSQGCPRPPLRPSPWHAPRLTPSSAWRLVAPLPCFLPHLTRGGAYSECALSTHLRASNTPDAWTTPGPNLSAKTSVHWDLRCDHGLHGVSVGGCGWDIMEGGPTPVTGILCEGRGRQEGGRRPHQSREGCGPAQLDRTYSYCLKPPVWECHPREQVQWVCQPRGAQWAPTCREKATHVGKCLQSSDRYDRMHPPNGLCAQQGGPGRGRPRGTTVRETGSDICLGAGGLTVPQPPTREPRSVPEGSTGDRLQGRCRHRPLGSWGLPWAGLVWACRPCS